MFIGDEYLKKDSNNIINVIQYLVEEHTSDLQSLDSASALTLYNKYLAHAVRIMRESNETEKGYHDNINKLIIELGEVLNFGNLVNNSKLDPALSNQIFVLTTIDLLTQFYTLSANIVNAHTQLMALIKGGIHPREETLSEYLSLLESLYKREEITKKQLHLALCELQPALLYSEWADTYLILLNLTSSLSELYQLLDVIDNHSTNLKQEIYSKVSSAALEAAVRCCESSYGKKSRNRINGPKVAGIEALATSTVIFGILSKASRQAQLPIEAYEKALILLAARGNFNGVYKCLGLVSGEAANKGLEKPLGQETLVELFKQLSANSEASFGVSTEISIDPTISEGTASAVSAHILEAVRSLVDGPVAQDLYAKAVSAL